MSNLFVPDASITKLYLPLLVNFNDIVAKFVTSVRYTVSQKPSKSSKNQSKYETLNKNSSIVYKALLYELLYASLLFAVITGIKDNR